MSGWFLNSHCLLLFKAIVGHADEEDLSKYEIMGFQEGCGKAFDQLIEVCNT